MKKVNINEFAIVFIVVIFAVLFINYNKFMIKNNDKRVEMMIQNAQIAEVNSLNYKEGQGHWPTTNITIKMPKGILNNVNDEQVADLDEAALNIEFLSNDNDFGIVVEGEHEGKVFYIGNNGKGLRDSKGNVFYNADLIIKNNNVNPFIIPIPILF